VYFYNNYPTILSSNFGLLLYMPSTPQEISFFISFSSSTVQTGTEILLWDILWYAVMRLTGQPLLSQIDETDRINLLLSLTSDGTTVQFS